MPEAVFFIWRMHRFEEVDFARTMSFIKRRRNEMRQKTGWDYR
jgi:hypothetical protein